MPRELERVLKRAAAKRGLKPGSQEYRAYVYGTLDKVKKARRKKHATERTNG